jgi:signal transduction histidine kinase
LDEQKNALLTAVSHELRTPLTAILGASLTLERAGGRLSEEAIARRSPAGLARRSSASSGRCTTNSLRSRSSRAWLAARQLGSLGALARFGVHRFGRAMTRA